ncbi:MAG: hypothetical protein CMN73_04215 [Sphingomonas sp.]|nr:hypothetical protein [Sphingomonas sp.]|tara:strand:+ start:232 stop:564 length:333 start_codon:yes stop_codon:yes gene_type:complete
MTLIEHLQALASLWSETTGRSTARLATMVVNDGKFFVRLANGGSPTVATFDRFIAWLRDDANWPGQSIPAEAVRYLESIPGAEHADSDSAVQHDASCGKDGRFSGGRAVA